MSNDILVVKEERIDRLKNITRMNVDVAGNAIPAICLRNNDAHHLTAGASASRNAVPFSPDTLVLAVFAEGEDGVYIKFGDSTVVATTASHFFPSGIYYNFAVKNSITHMSVLRAGGEDALVHISECF